MRFSVCRPLEKLSDAGAKVGGLINTSIRSIRTPHLINLNRCSYERQKQKHPEGHPVSLHCFDLDCKPGWYCRPWGLSIMKKLTRQTACTLGARSRQHGKTEPRRREEREADTFA